MRMQTKEFAELSGVSVRTLHYYDEIGLLQPGFVDPQTGYRYYNEESLERMQQILFFRELDFPLKTIRRILASPNYDKYEAMHQHKQLLILKKKRLERLIDALNAAEKGETMDISIFDNTQLEQYAQEAEKRWGETEAYKESSKKTAAYGETKWNELKEAMLNLIRAFGTALAEGVPPEDDRAQALVQQWQEFISTNYYTCTNEILMGLGQMYTADERFKKNMDCEQPGTAEYVAAAIRVYCNQE